MTIPANAHLLVQKVPLWGYLKMFRVQTVVIKLGYLPSTRLMSTSPEANVCINLLLRNNVTHTIRVR